MGKSTITARLRKVYQYLKEQREAHPEVGTYSQNRFGQEWGINSTSISNYMTGVQVPNGLVWEKFAHAFDEINMDWLFTGKGSMVKTEQEYASHMGVAHIAEEVGVYHRDIKMITTAKNIVDYWQMFHTEMESMRTLVAANLQNDIG